MEKLKATWASVRSTTERWWDKTAYAINFEWLSLRPLYSGILLATIFVALSLVVGLTAVSVKNGVTLGVEFGGGYEIRYLATQKEGGPNVTEETMQAQARSMYMDCVNNGHSNCVVQYYMPDSFNVIIPGVSTEAEVQPVLDAFAKEPLALTLKFSLSLSGVLGTQDLEATIRAAGIAFAIVWAVLLLRYWVAGALGLYMSIVFIWLLMICFNASPTVLSEAAIVAFVLNIGFAADAHILTFERARELLHGLSRDATEEEGLEAFLFANRTSLVTILEANITTLIAMLILYLAGIGSVADFAFMVLISVAISILINVIFTRLVLRLAWNSKLIRTGGFYGDRGPAYDDDKTHWWQKIRFWKPVRAVNINWVFYWWIGVSASLAVFIAGAVYLANQDVHPLNLDIDFTRGTALDVTMPSLNFTGDGVASIAEDTSGKSVATFAVSGQQVAIRFDDVLGTSSVQHIIKALEKTYHGNVTFEENTVDPTVAIDMLHRAYIAIIVSAVCVDIFVLLRFNWVFALSAFFAMASAGIYSLCCFALGAFEIDVTFVAAVLTVFSYAVNDCIVVFDRIRFETEKAGPKAKTPQGLKEVVNEALARICIRSVLTLAMVMVCSLLMVFQGAEPLRAFSLAITFGLLSSTYTTLLIVAPLYYYITLAILVLRNKREDAGEPENQKRNSVVGDDASAWDSATQSRKMSCDDMELLEEGMEPSSVVVTPADADAAGSPGETPS